MATICLMTLYNPNLDVISNIKSIASQCDRLFLLDNGKKLPQSDFDTRLPANVQYIKNSCNLGISMAFNTVLLNKTYNWHPDDFIIFFDQDSTIVVNHINKLIKCYNNIQDKKNNIGCIGPLWVDRSINQNIVNKNSLLQTKKMITSSMLIKYKTLKSVAFWNEDIFLDLADWDLCWRLNYYGYKHFLTSNVIMKHQLGNGVKGTGIFKVKNGSPIREYYQIRDGIKLFKKNYVPLNFKIRIILMISIRSILHLVILEDKKLRLHYILRGIKDGIKKINGEYCTDKNE